MLGHSDWRSMGSYCSDLTSFVINLTYRCIGVSVKLNIAVVLFSISFQWNLSYYAHLLLPHVCTY